MSENNTTADDFIDAWETLEERHGIEPPSDPESSIVLRNLGFDVPERIEERGSRWTPETMQNRIDQFEEVIDP